VAFTIRDYMQGGSVLHSLAGGFAAGDPGEVDASSMSTGPGAINARDFSQKSRKKLAKSGAAMPGGGFPIVNRQDLKNAEQAIGRAKNPGAARAHIRERAKALHVKVSKSFKAYGTSEGASKGWDTRGRGRTVDQNLRHGQDTANTVREFGYKHKGFDDNNRAIFQRGGHTMSVSKGGGWKYSGPGGNTRGGGWLDAHVHLGNVHEGMGGVLKVGIPTGRKV
jgi:hypothetical protein